MLSSFFSSFSSAPLLAAGVIRPSEDKPFFLVEKIITKKGKQYNTFLVNGRILLVNGFASGFKAILKSASAAYFADGKRMVKVKTCLSVFMSIDPPYFSTVCFTLFKP